MFELHKGGFFMYVIGCVSIVALAIFLERFVYLYLKMKLNMDKALKRVLAPLERKDFNGAIQECIKLNKHPLGGILQAGLMKADRKDQEIERAMEEKIIAETPRVKTRINLLSLFANIATLLGLLGTILGLMKSFAGVSGAKEGAVQEVLAGGIAQAMLTTAGGLVVAIPCLIGFYVLNNRGEYLVEKIEEKALGLANVLSAMKEKRTAHGTVR